MGANLLKMFDKLDDIVYLPVKAVTNWVEEPLRRYEHEREMESTKQQFDLEVWKEKEKEKLREEAQKADLDLQNMRDDAHFARQKAAFEAFKQYQIDLAKVNTAMIDNIGKMSVTLRNEVNRMVNSYVQLYREQQEAALQKADARMEEIQTRYANNDSIRDKMAETVIVQITSIINTADTFCVHLANDLDKLNALMDGLVEGTKEDTRRMLGSLPIGDAQRMLASSANPSMPSRE